MTARGRDSTATGRPWLAGGLWLLLAAGLAAWLGLQALRPAPSMEGSTFMLGVALAGMVGALIIARQPRHLVGWCFYAGSLLALMQHTGQAYAEAALVARPGSLPGGVWAAWLASWTGDIGWAMLVIFAPLLFPTGRPPSARWRPIAWLGVAALALHLIARPLRPGPLENLPAVLNPLGQAWTAPLQQVEAATEWLIIALVLSAIGSLVVRFRTARGELRQQLKWVAYVAAINLALFVMDLTITPRLPPAVDRVLTGVEDLGYAAFPVAVGLAILRYRLYDIDVIIRRTLVYGLLTAVLAVTYAAGVLVFEALLRPLTGAGGQAAIVVSTLVAAALFHRVRAWVQGFIDQRFYRRKYDAAQVLAVFGAALRDDTYADLETLRQRLLAVVDETMQPEHVSLALLGTPSKH